MNSKQRQQRAKLVDKINTIEGDDLESFAPQAVAAFNGVTADLWWNIDNAIGNAQKIGLKKPHLLRQVRNSPIWGPALFGVLRP